MPGFGKVVSKTKAFGGASSGAGGSVKAKPTIKLVGKKAMMKTKTIVDALQTLNLIPSFSTSDFGGDILPENVLVKNILEGMESSLNTLALIIMELKDSEKCAMFLKNSALNNIKPNLMKLSDGITTLESLKDEAQVLPLQAEDYDADVEGIDDRKQRKSKKEKRSRSITTTKSGGSKTHSTKSSISDQPKYLDEEQIIISSSRDLLLMIQNDKSQSYVISRALSEKRVSSISALKAFLYCLAEMVEYSKAQVTIPYETRLSEVESLCGSIFMSQKLKKTINKIRGTLDEVKGNHSKLTEEKSKEKQSLMDAEKNVRSITSEKIKEMHENVDATIKTLAWNSHARQTKALHACSKLKLEFDSSLDEHTDHETKMRHANIKLETEISQMIKKFDEAMFEKHHDIDRISKEYASEQVELEDIENELEKIEAERDQVIAEKKQLEEEERNAKLMEIRRNVAAKCIQRAYRSYMARKLLRKKKRKKKKDN